MNKSARNSAFFVLITLVLGLFHTANAQNFSVQPRFEVGLMDYEFQQEAGAFTTVMESPLFQSNVAQGELEIEDTLPFVNGGVTVFVDRFFVDLSVQHAFDGDDSGNQQISNASVEEIAPGVFGTQFTTNDIDLEADIDRTDYNASVGYRVTDSFIVFAGYRKSETEFELDRRGTVVQTTFDSLSVIRSDILVATSTDKLDYEVDQDGPFVGGAYGWIIDEGFLRGSLTANVAVAFLDQEIDQKITNAQLISGSVTDNITGQVIPLEPGPLPDQRADTLDGDTVGVTFGLGWRGFTEIEGLTYSLNVSGYTYSFDGDSALADSEETSLLFKAGIGYSF